MSVSRVGYSSLHWAAVIVYGAICAVGFVNMWLGLILLGLYAVIAAFKAIFSNPLMLCTLLIIVGVSTVFPPAALLLPIIAVFLFFKRIGFIASHIKVVATGILVYLLAILLCVAGSRSFETLPLQAGVFPGFLAGAIMHGILHSARKWGYTTGQALEIMSVVPLLIAAMILPFLKFDIGLDHFGVDAHTPLEGTVVDHAGGSAEGAALSYGINKAGIPGTMDPDVSPFEPTGASPAGMLAAGKSIFQSDVGVPPHHDVVHTVRVTDSLGRTHEYIESNGPGEVIRDRSGMPVGRIEHSGNTDYLKDNLGRTVLTKEHGISSDTVYDRLHQPVVRIEHGVNADQMKDDLGRTVLTKEHGISSDTLYDELHRPVGRIEHGISTANVPAGGSTT